MELRQLQVKDVFAVARMLGKITKGARLELVSAFSGKQINPTELGVALLQSIFTEAEDDLKVWLADLASVDKAEFEKMPAVAVLDIVEKLAEQEDIRDFFTRASLLAGKIAKKEKPNSTT